MTNERGRDASAMGLSAWLTMLAAIPTLTIGLVGCSSQVMRTPVATDPPAQEVTESQEPEAEEVDVPQQFIADYNATGVTPLTVVEAFDPHDHESPHYRTEFRLGAFDGSDGLYCTAGNLQVWVVFYGSHGGFGKNNELRIYAYGPKDDVETCYRVTARILDPSVSEEAINEAIDSSLKGYGNGQTINGSNINPTLFYQKTATDWEAMLDCKVGQ